jgi:hypothetical protein
MREIIEIISVDFGVIDYLLIRYSAYRQILRKNSSKMGHYMNYS